MAYTRPNIVSGVTKATKSFFENILDGIDERATDAANSVRYASRASVGAKPQTMALLGDSITNQCSVTQSVSGQDQTLYTMASWWDKANVLLGNRFKTVWQSATEREFGGSGLRSDQLISNGFVAGVLTSGASWCHLMVGTNDAAQDIPAATVLNNIKTICNTLTGAGITVVLATILPRTVASGATGAAAVDPINDLIRKWAPGVPGVLLNDWAPVLVDPTTGAAFSSYFRDGVHPNGAAGFRLGYTLAQLLRPITSPSAPSLDRTGLLGVNGLQLGVGGFKSGAGSAGITGDVAANNTCYAETGATIVGAKVARTDLYPGAWQQYTVTGAPSCIHSSRNSDPSKWSVGDLVYGLVEYQIDAAAWQGKNLGAMLMCLPGSSALSDSSSGFGDTVSSLPTVDGKLLDSGIIVTPPLKVIAGTTALRLDATTAGGNHIVRWGRMQIHKVV